MHPTKLLCSSSNQHSQVPVGEELQLLGTKLGLIEQDMVMARPVGSLDSSMAVQVEVELGGVADVPVDQSACNKNSRQLATHQARTSLRTSACRPIGVFISVICPAIHDS